MKKALFFFILLAASLIFISCKKDPTKNAKLPPITQEGKNTVGFTIDGEVWVPYYKCGFMRDPCGEINASYGEAGGAAPNGIDFGFTRMRKDKMSYLLISTGSIAITTVGEKTDSIYASFVDEDSYGNNKRYSGPLPGSKFVITKLDKQTQIISGEFEFILREENGSGRVITIKDGRFDFRFNACKCSQ